MPACHAGTAEAAIKLLGLRVFLGYPGLSRLHGMHCARWPMVGSTREQTGEVGLAGVPLCSELGGTSARPCCWGSRQGVEMNEAGCVSAMPLHTATMLRQHRYRAGSTMPTLLTNQVEAA